MESISSIQAWKLAFESQGYKATEDVKKYYLENPNKFWDVDQSYQIFFLSVFKSDPEIMAVFPYQQTLQYLIDGIFNNPIRPLSDQGNIKYIIRDFNKFLKDLIDPEDQDNAIKLFLNIISNNPWILNISPEMTDLIQRELLEMIGQWDDSSIIYRRLFPSGGDGKHARESNQSDLEPSKKMCQ